MLRIGYQERPDLFALNIKKREPLYDVVVEIDERISVDGHELISIDEDQVRRTLRKLKENKIESLAISFLHGYRFPGHEQMWKGWPRHGFSRD